jgi:hypothetical protein
MCAKNAFILDIHPIDTHKLDVRWRGGGGGGGTGVGWGVDFLGVWFRFPTGKGGGEQTEIERVIRDNGKLIISWV